MGTDIIWRGEGEKGDEVPTLMQKALRKAAGSLSLYWLVTSTPPSTVAALLAKVNWKNETRINTLDGSRTIGVLYLKEPINGVGHTKKRSGYVLRGQISRDEVKSDEKEAKSAGKCIL